MKTRTETPHDPQPAPCLDCVDREDDYQTLAEDYDAACKVIKECEAALEWVDKYVSCALSGSIKSTLASIRALEGEVLK